MDQLLFIYLLAYGLLDLVLVAIVVGVVLGDRMERRGRG